MGSARAARLLRCRRVGSPRRQLQVDRDEAVRGAGRLGGHRARARREMRLGTHCYHHAWHSELWHKRLPELREMNPDRLTVPPNDEMVVFVDAMTGPEAPDQTIEKLVGVYRVLIPHKIAAYTYHLNNTSTITDAPTIRSLRLALNDEFEDWRDGEMMIQSLIYDDGDVERAAQHQARLEKLMVQAGGIAGPG